MDTATKEQLIKRLKSFLWRSGSYIVVAGMAAIVDILGIYKIDPAIIAVVSLVCGEITKYINTFSVE